MKIISIDVGRSRNIFGAGKMIRAAIVKSPVEGPMHVNAQNPRRHHPALCLHKKDFAAMRRVVEVKALSESWRGYFRRRIENAAIKLTIDHVIPCQLEKPPLSVSCAYAHLRIIKMRNP